MKLMTMKIIVSLARIPGHIDIIGTKEADAKANEPTAYRYIHF